MTSASVLVAAVLQVLHARSIRHLQPCPHAGNLHGAQFLHYSQPHPLSRGIPILTCTSRSPTPRAAQKTPIFNFLHCSRISDNCVNVFDYDDFMYNNFLVVSTYNILSSQKKKKNNNDKTKFCRTVHGHVYCQTAGVAWATMSVWVQPNHRLPRFQGCSHRERSCRKNETHT